jgi:hypothetical protein
MASSFTTNKNLEKPGNGDYVNTWNVPVNSDMNVIDQAFGSTTSLNATSGSATLTSTQYASLFIGISGAISAGVTYTIPSGVGGQWIVYNSTTDSSGGPWAVTIASAGGGRSAVVARLSRVIIVSDGTNIDVLGYVSLNGTSTGSVTLTGSLTAGTSLSAGTTVTAATSITAGTTVTAGTSLSAGTTVTAATSITAGTTASDSIGNLRDVPANAQTSAYVLVATDSGKYIAITTGGVTVPSSIFSVGQTISVYNNSGTNQTITQGSGVTMILAGLGTTGNRTLAQYGLATLLCTASNTFVITGAGVS